MPWLLNDHVSYPQIMEEFRYNTQRYSDFYRSRTVLDTELAVALSLILQLECVPEQLRTRTLRLKTKAVARGLEADEIKDATIMDINSMFNNNPNSRNIIIYNISNNQTVIPSIIAALKEGGCEEVDYRTALTCNPFHTVITLKKLTAGNPAIPGMVVFTNSITDEFLLKLYAVYPLMCGYEIPQPITDTLLSGDKQAFIAAYMGMIEPLLKAREAAKMAEAIRNLEQYLTSARRNTLTNDIANTQNAITSRVRDLDTLYVALRDLQLRDSAQMWESIALSASEFIKYLTANEMDKITALQFGSGRLNVQLITKLAYWEDKYFLNYANSHSSNCVTDRTEPYKALLHNIFIDKTVEFMFHTGISITFNNNMVERYTAFNPVVEKSVGAPHTHIHYHNCWGNNEPLIKRALINQDYIIAWEQIKATLSGINITDTAVFRKFVEYQIVDQAMPYLIIKATGEKISPVKFIERFPTGWKAPEPEAEPVVVAPKRRRVREVTE